MGLLRTIQLRRFSVRRLLNYGVPGVVIVAVVAVWWTAVHTILFDATPPPVVGQPRALAWGDRVFANETQLRSWFRQRGIRYDIWARRHAGAVAIIEHRAVPVVTATKVTKSATIHPNVRTKGSNTRSAEAQASPARNSLLGYITWGLVAALVAAALAPRRWYVRLQYHAAGALRMYAVVAACAVTVGSLVARI